MFDLIQDIREERIEIDRLVENANALTDSNPEILFEVADRYIGNVIAALTSGKNPWETMPNAREVIAGLMMAADEDEAAGLNINDKKFNVIKQKLDHTAHDVNTDGVKKFLVAKAKQHVPSRIELLNKSVVKTNDRKNLITKLRQLQQKYMNTQLKVGKQTDSKAAQMSA